MLIVQVVDILWTKATRGAPRSNERAILKRSFAIDLDAVVECMVQRYRMSEWESFTPQIIKVEKLPSVPGSVDVLRIKAEKGGAFALGILGTPNSGQPRRHAVNGAIQLLPDQWARLTVNARHTSYSGQHYSETIFNVTFGATVPSNRFLLGPPDHDLDLKADLF
jgi:hypothetical protein